MATIRPGRIVGVLARWSGPVAVAGGLALCPRPAMSTSVVQLNDEALVRLSTTIVEGRVASVRSAWNSDHTQIVTTVEIRVDHALKGSSPANGVLTLHLLGGRVGDTVMELVGGPTFQLNEDVILFVEGDGTSLMPVTGLDQGKLTISTDATTGQKLVAERGVSRDVLVEQVQRIVDAQKAGR